MPAPGVSGSGFSPCFQLVLSPVFPGSCLLSRKTYAVIPFRVSIDECGVRYCIPAALRFFLIPDHHPVLVSCRDTCPVFYRHRFFLFSVIFAVFPVRSFSGFLQTSRLPEIFCPPAFFSRVCSFCALRGSCFFPARPLQFFTRCLLPAARFCFLYSVITVVYYAVSGLRKRLYFACGRIFA